MKKLSQKKFSFFNFLMLLLMPMTLFNLMMWINIVIKNPKIENFYDIIVLPIMILGGLIIAFYPLVIFALIIEISYQKEYIKNYFKFILYGGSIGTLIYILFVGLKDINSIRNILEIFIIHTLSVAIVYRDMRKIY